ncbi:MAG: hypothetical protein RLP44_02540 [Aggregatilineales bacterium]
MGKIEISEATIIEVDWFSRRDHINQLREEGTDEAIAVAEKLEKELNDEFEARHEANKEAGKVIKEELVASNGDVDDELYGVADDQPEFDFSRINWGITKKITRMRIEFREIMEIAPEEMTTADMKRSADLTDQLMEFVSKTVTYIPRDWLDEDAPEGLDWGDPESLDWLQNASVRPIILAFNKAESLGKKK